ncbi:cytochrome P450 [Mycena leptocephala]|nr:cytochrome P450 [Mycena leptocephala]
MSTSLGHGLRYVAENAMNYGTVSVAVTSIVILYLVRTWGNSGGNLRQVPGPPSPSWIFGHMLQLLLPATYGDYEFGWQKLYGPVYRLKGCFGQDRLMVSDAVSLQYVLNSPDFWYGAALENAVYFLTGKQSLMGAKDHNHKRLRAALNVGFTAAAVRNYLAVFERTAQSLAEQLEDTSGAPIDICPLLSFSTLNTISEAALGHPAKDLGEDFILKNSEIGALVSSQSSVHILADYISTRLPIWVGRAAVYIPTHTFRVIRATKRLSEALGAQVFREKTDAAQAGVDTDTDIYGQLVDLHRSDKNALTEDEIIAQTGMILTAGQETTTNTLAFGLWELARTPELQEKLRAEIHSMGGSKAYDNMPLLNAFIKETLRLYPSIPIAERMAIRDTLIPLATNITTSTGESISHIHVRKGQGVSLGIASYHRQESRWGEDAHEFNPFRWLSGKTTHGDALGPYATLLSFLGGPRTCLGWRFALLEMQVFICELVGKFSFTPPEDDVIRPRFVASLMPTLRDGKKGAPLCVKRIV